MTASLVVIPARYASSRLPGKPLRRLGGRSVLERTFERCVRVVPRDQVVVATDDDRIAAHCDERDMPWTMTSPEHATGTDRVAETATGRPADWYVNVQGDEPFLDLDALRSVLDFCDTAPPEVEVVNTYAAIADEADFRSTTVPKVVVRPDGRLQYISRAAIPTTKSLEFVRAHRQVGLYAFRPGALRAFADFGDRGALERLEDIEILRFLDLLIDVHMLEVASPGIAIDTPEDLERATRALENAGDD